MGFAAHAAAAIETTYGGRALDDLARLVWRGLAENAIDEAEADDLLGRIHARRMAARGPEKPAGRQTRFGPPPTPQRAPVRAHAIERRRRLAASGPMPPALAARFTTAELSVLAIVADEVRRHGRCDRSLDEIAARAGVSRSTVKNALRAAQRLGLIRVTLRPVRGRKNLPNVIEITDAAWRAWIARGPRRPARVPGAVPGSVPGGIGVKKLTTTDTREKQASKRRNHELKAARKNARFFQHPRNR